MEEIKKIITNFFLINEKENPKKEKEIYNQWKKIVDKKTFKNTKIIKTEKQTLFIKTKNPVYRNELSFKKKTILREFNKNNKNIKLKEIIIK